MGDYKMEIPLLDVRDINLFKEHCVHRLSTPFEDPTKLFTELKEFYKKEYHEEIITLIPSYFSLHGLGNRIFVISEKHISIFKFKSMFNTECIEALTSTQLDKFVKENLSEVIDKKRKEALKEIYVEEFNRLKLEKNIEIDTISGLTIKHLKSDSKDNTRFWIHILDTNFRFKIYSDDKLYSQKKLESLLLNEISSNLSKTKFFPKTIDFKLKNDIIKKGENLFQISNSGYNELNAFNLRPINYDIIFRNIKEKPINPYKVPTSGGNLAAENLKWIINSNDKDIYNITINNFYDSFNDALLFRSKLG